MRGAESTTMSISVEHAPYFWLIAGVASAALLSSLIPLAAALWRRARCRELGRGRTGPPGPAAWAQPWPEGLCLAALVAVPLALVLALHEARATILAGLATGGPVQRADLLAAGLSAQLSTLGLVLFVIPPAWIAGGAMIGLAAGYRLRLRGLQTACALAVDDPAAAGAWRAVPGPPPAILVPLSMAPAVLVLLPLASGIHRYVLELQRGIAALAGVDPAAKGELLVSVVAAAGDALRRGAGVAWAGLELSAAIAVLALVVFSPARRRRQLAPTADARRLGRAPSALTTAACASGCLLAAAALLVGTLPYRAENRAPLSAEARAIRLPRTQATTPALRGPDAVPRGPVLEVAAARSLLEDMEVTPETVGGQLALLRDQWSRAHPDEPFGATLVLLCAPDTPATRVLPYLHAAQTRGYDEVSFAFAERTALDRPLLGRLPVTRTSAARASLVASSLAAAVRPPAGATCATVAERIVRLRIAGQVPRLFVGARPSHGA